ncbi:MAG: hypothetical protein PUB31_07435 [Bacteroidales bacterium]|nr:hypothetical protein [Bacteroidales bacterium]MDD6613601.1 hypothetical protein [Bacteroidales bacterium]
MKKKKLILIGIASVVLGVAFVSCNDTETDECVVKTYDKKSLDGISNITGTFVITIDKTEYELYVLKGKLISSTNGSTGNVYRAEQTIICDGTFPMTAEGGMAADARVTVLKDKYDIPCAASYLVYNKNEKRYEYAVFYTVDEPCDWINELTNN